MQKLLYLNLISQFNNSLSLRTNQYLNYFLTIIIAFMKKSLFTIIAMMFAVVVFANNKYTIDDNQVESVMEQSVQIDFNLSQTQIDGILGSTSIQADPNPWVAFAISWVIGWTGVHRVYLGGKGSLILIYIVTCGGIFGIVPLIDWIVLLVGAIKGDISQFVGNDKFFMWGN